MRQIKSEIT